MVGEITMTIAFEISDSKYVDSIEEYLEDKRYFCIKRTPMNNKSQESLPNFMISCSKIIQDDEISQLHLVGENLIALNIGITNILSRSYSKDPKQVMTNFQKIKPELPHTLILFITIVTLLGTILSHTPELLNIYEIILVIATPITIDLIYLWAHITRRF